MESPYLQKMYQHYKKRGAVLGLAVAGDDAPSLKDFQARHKATYPIAIDTGNLFGHFELAFPSTVLVDRQGIIRLIEEGFTPTQFIATQQRFVSLLPARRARHLARRRATWR